ncbi:MAG: cellulase N-terminal Ig-like domain-containing protein, partial [Streptosporangiaceae bacterium]
MKSSLLTRIAVIGALAACAGVLTAPGATAQTRAHVSAVPQVRVNQVGYPRTGSKVAFVMLPGPVSRVSFTVQSPKGSVFLVGHSSDDLGPWNAAYRAVYELNFSDFVHQGRYLIKITSPARAVSPVFRIAAPSGLYSGLVTNAVRYFTSERDGADVDSSILHRQPANLTDRHAYVYA